VTRPERAKPTVMARMRVRMSDDDKGGCKGDAIMMVVRGEDEGDKDETENERPERRG
jgi:hypothetical protein